MSERFCWDLDGYEDPRFEGPSWRSVLLMLAFIVTIAMICCGGLALTYGAEPDRRPLSGNLWIYTDPTICAPCRRLEKDLKAGKMAGFQITRLAPPEGTIMPCIYYRDARGKWQYFLGWGPGEEAKFLAQWKRDTKP